MPCTREELKTMRKRRLVHQFVSAICREVMDAANQGKTMFMFHEPHYERAAWSEFLQDIVDAIEAEFPGCDVILDEHLGITVRWD